MKKLLPLAAAALLFGAGCSSTTATNVQTGTSVNPATNPNAPAENVNTQGAAGAGINVNVGTPMTVSASIQGMAFAPDALTVTKGDKVVFTNNDSVTHTVTADGGAFDSGNISSGSTYTLDTSTLAAGTYTFHCSIHPTMHGTLIVQ